MPRLFALKFDTQKALNRVTSAKPVIATHVQHRPFDGTGNSGSRRSVHTTLRTYDEDEPASDAQLWT